MPFTVVGVVVVYGSFRLSVKSVVSVVGVVQVPDVSVMGPEVSCRMLERTNCDCFSVETVPVFPKKAEGRLRVCAWNVVWWGLHLRSLRPIVDIASHNSLGCHDHGSFGLCTVVSKRVGIVGRVGAFGDTIIACSSRSLVSGRRCGEVGSGDGKVTGL